jgi:L-cystine transport system substrate-binding protein
MRGRKMKVKSMKRKTVLMILLTLCMIASFSLTACGGSDSSGVTTVTIGTSNDYPPFCYLDENGELKGYEIAVLKAIDEKLPEYKFKYEVLDFKNILTSLESGRVDLAAHQFGDTPERREKFQFGQVGYFNSSSYIVVSPDRNDIASLDDLVGLKVSVPPASNWAAALEKYNEEHPDSLIDIQYYEATPDIFVANMDSGVIDAAILTESDVKLTNTFWGKSYKTVGEPIDIGESDLGSLFVFRKDETTLADAVDKALKELKDSGELDKLSEKSVDDFFASAGK